MIVPSNEKPQEQGILNYIKSDSGISVNNYNSTESNELKKVYYEVGCKIFEINKIFK
jgi:hypothetical protein